MDQTRAAKKIFESKGEDRRKVEKLGFELLDNAENDLK
jgi:hypothetical protein